MHARVGVFNVQILSCIGRLLAHLTLLYTSKHPQPLFELLTPPFFTSDTSTSSFIDLYTDHTPSRIGTLAYTTAVPAL